MPVTDLGLAGSALGETSGATLSISLTKATQVGDVLTLFIAADNLSASTPTVTSITDTKSTWTMRRTLFRSGTAENGIMGSLWSGVVNTAHTIGNTVVVNLSAAVVKRAAELHLARGVDIAATPFVSSATGADALGANALAISLTVSSSGSLVVAGRAMEHVQTPTVVDTDTLEGSWSAVSWVGTTGTASTGVGVAFQSKVTTGRSTQSHTMTPVGAGTDTVAMGIVYPSNNRVSGGKANMDVVATTLGRKNVRRLSVVPIDIVASSGARKTVGKGSVSTIEAHPLAGSSKTGRKGSIANVTVLSAGSGRATRRGGSVPAVAAVSSGGGRSTRRGGSLSLVSVVSTGDGEIAEEPTGGSIGVVNIHPSGGGSTLRSGGSKSTTTIVSTGSGIPRKSSGGNTGLSILASGGAKSTRFGGSSGVVEIESLGGGVPHFAIPDTPIEQTLFVEAEDRSYSVKQDDRRFSVEAELRTSVA